jgi:hypothetical protein
VSCSARGPTRTEGLHLGTQGVRAGELLTAATAESSRAGVQPRWCLGIDDDIDAPLAKPTVACVQLLLGRLGSGMALVRLVVPPILRL